MANKAELVSDVASATGLTKKDATTAVDAVFSAIQASLAKGEKVQLIGFGNFEVRQRAARKGRKAAKNTTKRLFRKSKSPRRPTQSPVRKKSPTKLRSSNRF